MSDNSADLKSKIERWLTEEQFAISEQNDPKTFFNLAISRGILTGNIAAPRTSKGVVVAGGTALAPQAIQAYQQLEEDKKKICLDELVMFILSNPSIAEYSLGPNPPAQFELLRCVSKPLFYNTITKEGVIGYIYDIHKAWLAVQTILSKYTGFHASGKAGPSFYG